MKTTMVARTSKIVVALIMAFSFFYFPLTANSAPRRKKIKTIEPTPVIPESFYDKAWRNFQIGSTKEKAEVIKELKAILRKSPDEFMAHYYLGIMISQEGSPTTALRHFETALLGFPKSADIHARIGELYSNRNKTEEATDHFRKALELEPNNARALAKLGIFELGSGNLDAALDLLTRARQVQPDNPDTLRGLGAILLEKNSANEALPILEQALLFDEKHAETQWLLGRTFEKLNKPAKAAEHYELAKKYGRRDPEIKELIGYDLAKSLAQSGKYEEAEKEFLKLIRAKNDPATGYSELAQLYEDIGREDDAIKAYIKAFEIDRKLSSGILKAANIYLDREDYDNAENLLSLIKNDSELKEQVRYELKEIEHLRETMAQIELENSLNESQNTDADIENIYYEMLDQDKKNVQALEGLMNFYQERGYYEEALSFFRKYNRVNPTSDYNKKTIEKEIKDKLARDNMLLFGTRSTRDPGSRTIAADELKNLAEYGENDRVREMAMLILSKRKEHKNDRRWVEGLLEFYTRRGNTKEALKCVSAMKRLGFYNSSEAADKRRELRGK